MLRRSERLKNKALKLEGEEQGEQDAIEEIDLTRMRTPRTDAPDGTDTDEEVAARDGTTHPLQNPVILHHLFQLCPASTLASCRRVCKLWYDESLVTWRTKVPLQVTVDKTDIVLGSSNTPFQNVLEFVNEPRSHCSLKPYRNVRIQQIQDCNGRFHPVNDVFWESMGSNLTTLELDFYHFTGVDEFRQIIYKWCPNLINLIIKFPIMMSCPSENQPECMEPAHGEHKQLKFLNVELEYFMIRHLPVSWIELFSHFPSLTAFRLYYCSNNPYPRWEELMNAIRIIRKHDKNKLPFKRFDYFPNLKFSCDLASARNFAVIRELRLPLSRFSIVVNPNIDENRLMNTLNGLRESVKGINLVKPKEDEHLDQAQFQTLLIKNFPFGIQLDNLQTLTMQHDFCESFTFLKYTPNLLSLSVHDSERNYYNKPTTTAISNTSTEELANVKIQGLETFYLDFIVSEDDLQRLINWMPKIRKLSMVLNDKQFGMVCQNWRNLKQLEVFGQELTNEGVAGIIKTEGINKADLCPNISKLISLETFQYDTSNLTTESVLDVFLQLPRLRILQRFALLPTRHRSDILYRGFTQDTVSYSWRRVVGPPIGEED